MIVPEVMPPAGLPTIAWSQRIAEFSIGARGHEHDRSHLVCGSGGGDAMPIEIDRESVDAKHEGQIDVVVWSWGLSLEPASGTGDGAGSDRVRIENIPIQKLVDLASRLLAANSERLVLANVPLEDLLRSRASVRLGRLVIEFKLGTAEGNALVQRTGKACSGRNADYLHGLRRQ